MQKKIWRFKVFGSKNLIHLITSKNWGNVSWMYGEPSKAKKNRLNLFQKLNIDPKKVWHADQVHGDRVVILSPENLASFSNQEVPQTDALVTNKKGIFLSVMTADCLPVLMFDPSSQAVAAVHVGWRGAVQKIFLKTLLKMSSQFGTKTADLKVGLGPAIKPCCFKQPEVIQKALPEWQDHIKRTLDGWQTDIKGFVQSQLEDVGVKRENIESCPECTSCDSGWYSYRKDREIRGTMMSLIGIKN